VAVKIRLKRFGKIRSPQLPHCCRRLAYKARWPRHRRDRKYHPKKRPITHRGRFGARPVLAVGGRSAKPRLSSRCSSAPVTGRSTQATPRRRSHTTTGEAEQDRGVQRRTRRRGSGARAGCGWNSKKVRVPSVPAAKLRRLRSRGRRRKPSRLPRPGSPTRSPAGLNARRRAGNF
jgi:hypothetical protein